MTNRQQTTNLINQIENDLKSLEVAYEQYFIGVEKRAPEQQRQKLALLLRKLANKYIPQTDLKFRLRGLTTRFQTYSSYWDRTMRLIEEGKYTRHTSRIVHREIPTPGPESNEPTAADAHGSIDSLYEKLVEAHRLCDMKVPKRDHVTRFLARQEEVIQQKFGERQVEFKVVTERGKPKIKVCAKS